MKTKPILQFLAVGILAVMGLQCSSDTPAPSAPAFVAPKETCFLKKISWGGDSSYLFSYNLDNKVTKIALYKVSLEIANIVYAYDSKGRVSTKEDVWITYNNKTLGKYEYNANDQIIKFTDNNMVATMTYDNAGRVQQTVVTSNASNFTRTYNYTTNNNISKMTFPNRAIDFTYDDKRNPFRNLPPFTVLIPQRFFMGRFTQDVAEQNCYNNVASFVIKTPDETSEGKITYTYNAQNYPTTVTYNSKPRDGKPIVLTATLEYYCP